MFIISKLAEKNPVLKKLKYWRVLCKDAAKVKAAQKKNRVMVLCGVPAHLNLGDQAQTYCTIKLLQRDFPGCQIVEFSTGDLLRNNSQLVVWLNRHLRKADKIIIQSGYNTTDLYMNEENMHRALLQIACNHPITILPQTIFFQNPEVLKKSSAVYNSHRQVKLYCRDRESYKTACTHFSGTAPELLPDIVTSEIGTFSNNRKRSGVLLCLRNDKERFYQTAEIAGLREALNFSSRVDTTDTTLKLDLNYVRKHRGEVLESVWTQYSSYQVIITDRYHGLIFGLTANTPVVVLQTCDHKLKSGIDWFPPQFSSHVFMAKDLDHAGKLAADILKRPDKPEALPDYFLQKYYNDLKKIVGD